MQPIYIIKFQKKLRPKAVAYSYDMDEVQNFLSKEETHGSNWFLGWSKSNDYSGANVNRLPLVKDCIREIENNPYKKITF